LEVILHRINTISELKNIESKYGVEIDIRAWGSELVLNHEPFQDGEKLVDYLDEYHHGTLVLNVKENGIEDENNFPIQEIDLQNGADEDDA